MIKQRNGLQQGCRGEQDNPAVEEVPFPFAECRHDSTLFDTAVRQTCVCPVSMSLKRRKRGHRKMRCCRNFARSYHSDAKNGAHRLRQKWGQMQMQRRRNWDR
eukprot:4178271-Pleurochrysis_carterae.AAC.1